MIIYKDVFSGDELASDSFPMKLVDDLVYEFKGKYVVRKEGEISLAGANPSAEGEDVDDGADEAVERGVDIVLNHKLEDAPLYETSTNFKSYVKEFSKKVLKYLEDNGKSADEVSAFKKKFQPWVLGLLAKDKFKTLKFYQGEKSSETGELGQLAILEYRDENGEEIPYLLLVKAAIEEEKC